MNDISNSNIDPEGPYNNNQAIFIWLDILGFSEATEDEAKYGELVQHLNAFQSIFNEGNG